MLFVFAIPFVIFTTLILAIEWDQFHSKYITTSLPSVLAKSSNPQKITLLNSGLASLWARLELIENAKTSVDIEYFIFELDQSARLVTQALIKKASEGVKVRVIVDFSMPVFKLNPTVAAFMQKEGVEVKYYNTVDHYQIFKVQHRSHRKLLVADGTRAITGGRNIANDYFDLSHKYNFYDTDLLIEGDIVESLSKSFNDYWNSDLAQDSKTIGSKFTREELTQALHFLDSDTSLLHLREKIQAKGRELLAREFRTTCFDSIYAADHPGSGLASRKVYSVLVEESTRAKNKIFLESPYFILKSDGVQDFKSIVDRNVDVTVLTNTLHSTDAYYTISAFAATLGDLNRTGIEVWGYKGAPPDPSQLVPEVDVSQRWGLHAKRGVIDDETTIVGTYNIDPRSANLNSEMIFICRQNKELARAVTENMEIRLAGSVPLVKQGCIECFKNLTQQTGFFEKMRFLILIPLASRLDFLL